MSKLVLARRYAEALLDVAVDQDRVQAFERQIVGVAETYEASDDLSEVLANPLINDPRKKRILDDIFSGEVAEEVNNLLHLLVEKDRSELIPSLADAYNRLADAYFGVVHVEVESARPLDEEKTSKLNEELSRLMQGRDVEIEESHNPDLLAGFRVKIGDYVLDGSLKDRLENLEEAVTEKEGV